MAAVLAAFVLASSLIQAQGPGDFIPIDHKGEAPSSHSAYMQNRGQLTAMQGGLAPDILYYSIQSFPQMFFSNKNEVFFQLGARDSSLTTPDSIYRVGMKFIGTNVNLACVPNAYEELPDYWNFILGHLAEPIMGLHASRRIVYPNVYPFIDFHAYSNPWGPKFYFVMRPGSDPSDLRLQFSGQDSLILDAYDQLKAYAGGLSVVLPKGLSYQQINGGTVLVDAEVDYELFPGEISVGFTPGAYDTDYPLIIDVSESFGAMGGGPSLEPEWGTFYGHTEVDAAWEGALTFSGGLVACGQTTSPEFPLFNAQFGEFNGGSEAYYSEFDEDYHRTYTTLFGGNGADAAYSVALSADQSSVLLYGRTWSTDLPVPSIGTSFNDVTNSASDCFMARFSRTSTPFGMQDWGTYFGTNTHMCKCVRIDANDNVHITGSAGGISPNTLVTEVTCEGSVGTYPICNSIGSQAFVQEQPGGSQDAFYARFDSELNLIHSTLIGGAAHDAAYQLAIDNGIGAVYVVGSTGSQSASNPNCAVVVPGEFPLCEVPGGYFQSSVGMNDGFVLCMNSFGEVTWSTYIGTTGNEHIERIGININGDVYVAGHTSAISYAPNNCGPSGTSQFPRCASGQQALYPTNWTQDQRFIMKFHRTTRQLKWSTFIYGHVESMWPDEGGTMIIGLTTGTLPSSIDNIPVLPRPNTYFQPLPADFGIPSGEGVVLGFSLSDAFVFGTYFGGYGEDYLNMALPWSGGRLYVLGRSYAVAQFPFNCPPTTDPYCYLSYATQSPPDAEEAFYAQLQYDFTIGLNEPSITVGSADAFVLFPNPSEKTTSLMFGAAWREAGIVNVEVVDPTGRVIRAWHACPASSPSAVSLEGITNGAYLVRVSNGATLSSSQVLVVQ